MPQGECRAFEHCGHCSCPYGDYILGHFVSIIITIQSGPQNLHVVCGEAALDQFLDN